MDTVSVSEKIFRPGSELPATKVALAFNCGGIGDYINWVSAIKYVIKTQPHIYGYVVCPPYFEDLCRLWFEGFSPRFEVLVCPDFNKEPKLQGIPTVVPGSAQMANASGFHLFRLGFIYYTQRDYVPPGARLPVIWGNEADVNKFNLPQRYAVLTPYGTADNRRLPAAVFNALTFHLIAKGITPVFLGKRELAAEYEGTADGELTTEGVIDLREQTSLREAACVMAGARFTFGCDNGLLHLASCTTAPVVWYFSSVSPEFRSPNVYRQPGAKTYVLTPPADLSCRFCNTNMRYIIGHDFKNCLYKDNLCVTDLKGSAVIKMLEEAELLK